MADLGSIAGEGTSAFTGGGIPSGGVSGITDALFIHLVGGITWLDTSLSVIPDIPTFSYRPTTCRQTNTYRTKSLGFGESIEQRQNDGLNPERLTYDLTFENVDLTEGNEIEAFISARAGVESFNWIPPGKSSSKYVCTEPISREWNPDVDGESTLTMKFRQVFEL